MKRRNLLTAMGLGLGGAVLATPAIAQGPPQIRWPLAATFPRELDILNGGVEVLVRRVAGLTGNRFVIGHDPSLRPKMDQPMLDFVGSGGAPIGLGVSYQAMDREPALVFDTSVPFGLNARQQNAWMYQGGGLALMRELLADHDVIPFPVGNTGSQLGGWFRREIRAAQDLNGLKFRVSGMAADVLHRLGGQPQRTGYAGLRTALEDKTLDAAAWAGPHDDLRLGLHKVAPYCYYPGFLEGNAQLSCYVNRQAWDRLPSEYREAVEVACAEANLWVTARYDALNPAALKQLTAEGAILRPFPLEILRAAHRATEEQLEALASVNGRFRKVYASWKPFRDAQHLWFRIAENSFDRSASLQPPETSRN